MLLSKELMKYPLVMKWASSRLDTFRDSMLLNTNHHFLRQFTGAEGLKTGYHPAVPASAWWEAPCATAAACWR